jgi:DNA-directed RNA polymerase subunit RPC12/RpoP
MTICPTCGHRIPKRYKYPVLGKRYGLPSTVHVYWCETCQKKVRSHEVDEETLKDWIQQRIQRKSTWRQTGVERKSEDAYIKLKQERAKLKRERIKWEQERIRLRRERLRLEQIRESCKIREPFSYVENGLRDLQVRFFSESMDKAGS